MTIFGRNLDNHSTKRQTVMKCRKANDGYIMERYSFEGQQTQTLKANSKTKRHQYI